MGVQLWGPGMLPSAPLRPYNPPYQLSTNHASPSIPDQGIWRKVRRSPDPRSPNPKALDPKPKPYPAFLGKRKDAVLLQQRHKLNWV